MYVMIFGDYAATRLGYAPDDGLDVDRFPAIDVETIVRSVSKTMVSTSIGFQQ